MPAASDASDAEIDLAWTASSDDTAAVQGYRVYRDGLLIATPVHAPFRAPAEAHPLSRMSVLDQQPTELQVFVRRGSGPSFEQREVTVNGGKLGPIPAGDWDYLLAMTRFSDGSAMYAWRLR